MHISRARELKRGERVAVPSDRGEPSYVGYIHSVAADAQEDTNLYGVAYIWVTISREAGPSIFGSPGKVWPSNRLGSM